MRIVERATRRRYTSPVPACGKSVKSRAIQNAGRLTGKKYDTIFASYR